MEINPISAGVQNPNSGSAGAATAARTTVAATLKPKQQSLNAVPEAVAKVVQPDKAEMTNAEQRRYEAVEQGAQAIAAQAFAVSDTRFTIYKDATGQFITRFTSLSDGSVTYYPEPEVAAFMAERSAERKASYDIDA